MGTLGGHWGETPTPIPRGTAGGRIHPLPSSAPLLLTAQFPRKERLVSRVLARGCELLRETLESGTPSPRNHIAYTICPPSHCAKGVNMGVFLEYSWRLRAFP